MKKLGKLTLKELNNQLPVMGNYHAGLILGGMRVDGSGNTWYTQGEMDYMINNNAWSGGFVDGMGYIAPVVTASGSITKENHVDNLITSWSPDGGYGYSYTVHGTTSMNGGNGEIFVAATATVNAALEQNIIGRASLIVDGVVVETRTLEIQGEYFIKTGESLLGNTSFNYGNYRNASSIKILITTSQTTGPGIGSGGSHATTGTTIITIK